MILFCSGLIVCKCTLKLSAAAAAYLSYDFLFGTQARGRGWERVFGGFGLGLRGGVHGCLREVFTKANKAIHFLRPLFETYVMVCVL